jgi:hypothetical protein
MSSIHLYLDETGSPDTNDHSKNYTLCGIVVDRSQSEKLKIKADQIKFKYWNDTNIVFHSKDIGLEKGEYAILKNPITKKDFLKDMFLFINNASFKCIVISIDKTKAISKGWNSAKIRDFASDKMIECYIEYLAKIKSSGSICLESAGQKDIDFYKRYTYYLSHGLSRLNLTHVDIKKLLTSISFASKKNHDTETQLADLLAYPATCHFLDIEGVKPLVRDSYEDRMCRILSSKIVDVYTQKYMFRHP